MFIKIAISIIVLTSILDAMTSMIFVLANDYPREIGRLTDASDVTTHCLVASILITFRREIADWWKSQ